MLKWFLFETRAGDLVAGLLERVCGVAVIEADELGELVNDYWGLGQPVQAEKRAAAATAAQVEA